MRVTKTDIELINYGFDNKLVGEDLERMKEIYDRIGDPAFQEINRIIAVYSLDIQKILDKTTKS